MESNTVRKGKAMVDLQSVLENAGVTVAPTVVCAVSTVIGLVALLYGYRLFKLFVFLAGFIVASAVVGMFTNLPVALLAGLLVGAICVALWYLGVFLIGALLGAVLALALGLHDAVLVAAPSLICGILAIAVRKLMIVLSTSWYGACLLSLAFLPMLGLHEQPAQLVVIIVLAVIGVVCQYTVTSGKKTANAPRTTAGEPQT